MIAVVALVATVVVALAAIFVFARILLRRERAWERKEMGWQREREVLLDRVMFLADKPWQMPETFQAEETPVDSTFVFPELSVLE